MPEDNEINSDKFKRKIDATDVSRLEISLNLTKEKIDSLKDNVSELTSRVKLLEGKKRKDNLKEALLYIIIFGAAAVFTVYFVAKGKTQPPTVSIIYNVGDVIGGLLVGVAAVLAGVSYMLKRRE